MLERVDAEHRVSKVQALAALARSCPSPQTPPTTDSRTFIVADCNMQGHKQVDNKTKTIVCNPHHDAYTLQSSTLGFPTCA